MKIKKTLILFTLVCFSVIFVACQDATSTTVETTTETPTTGVTTTQPATTTETTTTAVQITKLNILNGWSDSGDSVYSITESDTELAVTYDKNSFSWANMSYAIDTDLSNFNKLVFTVSGEGTLMVKIQGATEAFEVSIQLTAGEVTYQLNLRDYDAFLGGVTAVYIFAAPGKAVGTGNFTMSMFEFDEGTAYGNVLEHGDSNIPENQQIYDGTGETFDFTAGLIDNGDGIYTIDSSGDDPVVSYTKAAGFEWAYLISTVVGDFSDFDYLVLEVKGVTAGSVMFKAELSASVQEEIEGTFEVDEEITLCIDLTSWTDEELDALTKVLVFGNHGSAAGSGSFIVQGAYFSKVYVGEPIVDEDAYNFIDGWVENDADTYTFTTTANDTTQVDYTKGVGFSWAAMRNDFTAEAAEYNTITLTVKGEAGKSILVKPNDDNAYEQTITFDGTEQTITVSGDAFTKILIFAEPGSEDVTGSFEIILAVITYVEPDPLAASEVLNIQDTWEDNEGGIYTFTEASGVVTVDYAKIAGQEWASIKNTFSANLNNHDMIKMVVQGTIGEQLIIKPNDNGAYEQTITFDGTEQMVVFELSDKPVNMLIFVDPINGNLIGSFDIISAEVYASNTTQVNFINDFEENDAGTYTFTPVASGIQVDYTKAAGQEWALLRADFGVDLAAGLNTMILTIQGTVDESILIKPNDANALEQTLTFDGTDQTLVITAESFQNLIMFAQPGSAGDGMFIIKEAKLCFVEDKYEFMSNWIDGGDAVYTITENVDGTVTVDYTKTAAQTWSVVRNNFTAEADGYNTMTITVKGTVGKTILVKPNDSGALEQTITFDGTEQTFVFSATAFTNILIFAEPNTGDVTGSFDIIEAKLTFVEPDALPAWEEVVLGNMWVDNDGGIYTFTEASGVVTVDFTKTAGQEWAYIIYTFEDKLDNHDTLTMVFNGTVGQQLIVKPNDNGAFEETLTFDGTDQTLTFDMTEPLTKIVIFVDPLNGGLVGSFDIVSGIVTSTAATYDFADGFVENDPGTYTFTPQPDGSVVVDYTKIAGQEWAFMKAEFAAEDVQGLDTITLVVQGTAGKTMLVKPNDDGGLQQEITFDGTEQTFVFSAASFNSLFIFVEQGDSDLTGSFTIISAVLSHLTS